MAETSIIEPTKAEQSPAPRASGTSKPRGFRFGWLLIGVLVVAAGGFGAFYLSRSGNGGSGHGHEGASADGQSRSAAQLPSVTVVKPTKGGMERTTNQPGTIRAFEFANLYAKVSGYLKELNVDRGDRVKANQLLTKVFDPELEVAVLQAQAALQRSQAAVKQTEARVRTAKVGVLAAEAKVKQAHAVHEEAVAQRTYQKKALDRITALASRNAVEQQLVDEHEHRYMSSVAAEHSAESGMETASALLEESKASVEQAEADLATAKVDVRVAEANLRKAKVFADYMDIRAPFDGVVTFRGDGVHRGAFIRSAMESANMEPLLTVADSSKMRTIVQVPDPDVPYCNPGDPVTIKIDALGGRVFKGTVTRMGEAEDLKDRTMRVEIDLPNPDGVLKDGMYGRAVIELEPPSKNFTIPATCLVDQNDKGEGSVYLVKDGKIKKVPVRVGKDDGLHVEVLSGLSPDDELVAQPTSSITEGIEVKPVPIADAKKTDSHE
jgi:RND family efflux transporter MFP subunit